MLIQAQNQKEQQSKASTDGASSDSSSPSDSDVKIKTELNSSGGGGGGNEGCGADDGMKVDENLPADIMSDVEMKDLSEKVVKTESGEEDAKVTGKSSDPVGGNRTETAGGGEGAAVAAMKDINIDPKTYCKLGHFHLLLEDYEKGRFRGKNTACARVPKGVLFKFKVVLKIDTGFRF